MLTMKQVDDRLRRLPGRYDKIGTDVQDMLVAIVNHANDTGDCDRARKIVRCLPARMRGLAKTWFAEVSPIAVTIGKTVNEDSVRLRKEGKKGYNPFDIDKAKANRWDEDPFKSAEAPPQETLQTYYDSTERLLERMSKNAAEDSEKIADADKERVLALRAHMRAAFIEFQQANPIAEQTEEEQEQQDDEPVVIAAAA